MTHDIHQQTIIAQFTSQAGAYTNISAHGEALEKLVQMSGVQVNDYVLDIACGSGIVACAFAHHAQHVTGIDITTRMLDEAKRLQQQKGLHNMSWHTGAVEALPYDNGAFAVVVSRFGFHHFLQPAIVLSEMARVCKKGGRVLVVDVALPADKVDAYNEMEKLRDPSHVAALTHAQFMQLFSQAGFSNIVTDRYTMAIGLEEQLQASFPGDEQKARLKEMILRDIGIDALGIGAREINGKVFIHYPVSIYVAQASR